MNKSQKQIRLQIFEEICGLCENGENIEINTKLVSETENELSPNLNDCTDFKEIEFELTKRSKEVISNTIYIETNYFTSCEEFYNYFNSFGIIKSILPEKYYTYDSKPGIIIRAFIGFDDFRNTISAFTAFSRDIQKSYTNIVRYTHFHNFYRDFFIVFYNLNFSQ